MLRCLFRLIFKIIFPIKLVGKDNLPQEGPAILCSNHISLLDPIVLGCISEPHVTFMAKKELFEIPIMRKVIKFLGALPVKRGQVDRTAIKSSLKELSNNQVFGIFPEGTRNSRNKKPLKGVGFLAAKSCAPVVPITIKGPYRLFRTTKVIVHPQITYNNFDNEDIDEDDPILEFSNSIMNTINSELK